MSNGSGKVGANAATVVAVVIVVAVLALVLRFLGWMLGLFVGGVLRLALVAGIVWLIYQCYVHIPGPGPNR